MSHNSRFTGAAAQSVFAIASLIVVLGMTACGTDDPGMAALAKEPTAADSPPADFEPRGINSDSLRFAAEQGGYSFYLALPEGATHIEEGTCLVLDGPAIADGPVTGCGGKGPVPVNGLLVGVEAGGITAHVIADDYDPVDELGKGWQKVHPNLLVKGL